VYPIVRISSHSGARPSVRFVATGPRVDQVPRQSLFLASGLVISGSEDFSGEVAACVADARSAASVEPADSCRPGRIDLVRSCLFALNAIAAGRSRANAMAALDGALADPARREALGPVDELVVAAVYHRLRVATGPWRARAAAQALLDDAPGATSPEPNPVPAGYRLDVMPYLSADDVPISLLAYASPQRARLPAWPPLLAELTEPDLAIGLGGVSAALRLGLTHLLEGTAAGGFESRAVGGEYTRTGSPDGIVRSEHYAVCVRIGRGGASGETAGPLDIEILGVQLEDLSAAAGVALGLERGDPWATDVALDQLAREIAARVDREDPALRPILCAVTVDLGAPELQDLADDLAGMCRALRAAENRVPWSLAPKLDTESGPVLVLCKDREVPRLAELEEDRAALGFAGAAVAIVAHEAVIAAIERDRRWDAFPRASWQRVWEVVDPAASPDAGIAWLRQSFRQVLGQFGLSPMREIAPAEVTALLGQRAKGALRRAELRAAVASLLPLRAAVPADAWVESGLDAWWETARKHRELPVEGLGIAATPAAGGALDWWLSLRPVARQRDLSRAGLREEGHPGWWTTKLFRGDPGGRWQRDVATAVMGARAVLRAIGLPTGLSDPTRRALTPTAEVVALHERAERTEAAITAAGDAIAIGIAARLGVARSRRYLHLDGLCGWIETGALPRVEVRLGSSGAENAARFPIIERWHRAAGPAEVALDRLEGSHAAALSADLRRTSLRAAVDGLVTTVERLVDENSAALGRPLCA
jgi:hypothetical protein